MKNLILIRKWNTLKKTPPTDCDLLLLFEDGSIVSGKYMPGQILSEAYQPFGTDERGIFTCKEKVIKWTKLENIK